VLGYSDRPRPPSPLCPRQEPLRAPSARHTIRTPPPVIPDPSGPPWSLASAPIRSGGREMPCRLLERLPAHAQRKTHPCQKPRSLAPWGTTHCAPTSNGGRRMKTTPRDRIALPESSPKLFHCRGGLGLPALRLARVGGPEGEPDGMRVRPDRHCHPAASKRHDDGSAGRKVANVSRDALDQLRDGRVGTLQRTDQPEEHCCTPLYHGRAAATC
jgi:hypothetical protein